MTGERQFTLIEPPLWRAIKDGDDEARAFFDRHYSRKRYADGREPKLIVGPGQKLVMVTPDRCALFAWRKFISDDGQDGVNCAIFRNEGSHASSSLIVEADKIADRLWPGKRHFTYVDPRKVATTVPGWSFILAGWQPCGITKWNKLLIFERIPQWQTQSISHRKSIAYIRTLLETHTKLTIPPNSTCFRTIEGRAIASSIKAA